MCGHFCVCVKCIAFGEPTQGHLGGNTQIPEKAARDVRLSLCQRGEIKLSRDASRGSAITRARGEEWGYSNALPGGRASCRLLFGDSMQRTAKRYCFFYAGLRLIAGVRCIGRSYRNRTYTMGVRGPCATTTPSSNARFCSSKGVRSFVSIVIIAHYFAFCNRFRQQY